MAMCPAPRFLVLSLLAGWAICACSAQSDNVVACNDEDRHNHPVLCTFVDKLLQNPTQMSHEFRYWADVHGLLVDIDPQPDIATNQKRLLGSNNATPVVFAHGMGDSCFNRGFTNLVQRTSRLLGNVYAVCIPTGKNRAEDTNNGYFLNMDASVEVFAEKVRSDPQLAKGFHAVGLSQGNNVIRGYIAKHNDPPVNVFLSINGVNAGEGAVPSCFPSRLGSVNFPSLCDLLNEQASRAAYTRYAQRHSFQANYWRDPRKSEFPRYQKYAQLAQWNNEGLVFNETLKENFGRTSAFVWIMATQDRMVWPREGEQWGAPDPKNPFKHVLERYETEWYRKDLFGLKTAEMAGKNNYVAFDGDHLDFSDEEYDSWVETYLTQL